jgi:hypothetical protein
LWLRRRNKSGRLGLNADDLDLGLQPMVAEEKRKVGLAWVRATMVGIGGGGGQGSHRGRWQMGRQRMDSQPSGGENIKKKMILNLTMPRTKHKIEVFSSPQPNTDMRCFSPWKLEWTGPNFLSPNQTQSYSNIF